MTDPCRQCGLCCRLFPVPLSEREYRSGVYRTFFAKEDFANDWQEVVICGAHLLAQKPDGSCIYLKKNRCSIHRQRPQVCREFFCTSKEKRYQKMIRQIEHARSNLVKVPEDRIK